MIAWDLFQNSIINNLYVTFISKFSPNIQYHEFIYNHASFLIEIKYREKNKENAKYLKVNMSILMKILKTNLNLGMLQDLKP